MLGRRGAVGSGDCGKGRERRVPEHDGRVQLGRQVVVDLLRVVPGDRRVAKEPREQAGAGLGDSSRAPVGQRMLVVVLVAVNVVDLGVEALGVVVLDENPHGAASDDDL